jgi:hypothetical protein
MYFVGADSAFDHDLEKALFNIKCNTLLLLLLLRRRQKVDWKETETQGTIQLGVWRRRVQENQNLLRRSQRIKRNQQAQLNKSELDGMNDESRIQ